MSPQNRMRIVLVEDNSADVFLIEEALRLRGIDYDMRRFESGDAALNHLCGDHGPESPPDVVLLDLHLPGTDGTAILRAIRDDLRLEGVPVVILTGAWREHLGHLDLSRASCVVHKSMDLDEYMRDVAQAVIELQLADSIRRRGLGIPGRTWGPGQGEGR